MSADRFKLETSAWMDWEPLLGWFLHLFQRLRWWNCFMLRHHLFRSLSHLSSFPLQTPDSFLLPLITHALKSFTFRRAMSFNEELSKGNRRDQKTTQMKSTIFATTLALAMFWRTVLFIFYHVHLLLRISPLRNSESAQVLEQFRQVNIKMVGYHRHTYRPPLLLNMPFKRKQAFFSQKFSAKLHN